MPQTTSQRVSAYRKRLRQRALAAEAEVADIRLWSAALYEHHTRELEALHSQLRDAQGVRGGETRCSCGADLIHPPPGCPGWAAAWAARDS